ncbi:anaerobic ribonucleoside-triphosphate reductase activating protein [Candidatus Woesearchaeota archaeon]|nr:anaerobic ribonucleoside-triphosphate reductase activating protein [Candidatus Woesearchaeota archaeon]
MEIKGFQKTSLNNYPDKVVSVLFLAGCNMRCPFCHNPELVVGYHKLPTLDEDEVVDQLVAQKKWIDGVVITGGEPTLNPDLPDFAARLKGFGLLVKVDTNGTNPALLKEMIERKVVDYVAMDIKAPKEKYPLVAGAAVDMAKVEESIRLLKESGIEHEFRTTVVPQFLDGNDILSIGRWLHGAERYTLQQFRSSADMLDNELKGEGSYSKEEFEGFRKALAPHFKDVRLVTYY